MKVLLISASDWEGGAARSAYRLHQGLQEIGSDSQILVQTKLSDDRRVIVQNSSLAKDFAKLRPNLNRLPMFIHPNRIRDVFSPQWIPDGIAAQVNKIAPDVINLHWVCGGYLQIETLAHLKQPIVWTFHDMWGFTGGCHFSGNCDRYTESCGTCPQLDSQRNWDISRWVWQRKAKAWKNLKLTIVTPSHWLAKQAQASSLFKEVPVEVIPYGLNTETYKPMDRAIARDLLKLPQDKQLILFGALNATTDPRKGFHLLQPALQQLSQSQWKEQIELVVFGASRATEGTELGFKSHYLGKLNDELSLALVYSAADVFILPSIQDTLPNTVMEALACGTPCVGFNIGGVPDMIEHQTNGYLAKPFEIEDLARGIVWILENSERYQKLSHQAREKVEREYTLERQARRYSDLFNQVMD
ncbi:glycosyltransferase family 4 protein [Laspinema palackyanum]|uniref:glycosyltransferase family 4 protein n=1 Tax=Laspinema palackyanum TaxID=3231601 RepID=UPI00345C8761|nr:glycosyltransferase family 4 protein [Laspinema sp. D2c]